MERVKELDWDLVCQVILGKSHRILRVYNQTEAGEGQRTRSQMRKITPDERMMLLTLQKAL